jgi:hypothetical protein
VTCINGDSVCGQTAHISAGHGFGLRESQREASLSVRTGKFSGLDTSTIPGHAYQCPLCLELFVSEKTFVFHRVDDRTPPGRPGVRLLGPCQDPASKGLTLGADGAWKWYPAPLRGDDRRDLSGDRPEAQEAVYPPLSTTRRVAPRHWEVCKRCGEPFEPERRDLGRFCSNDCRVKYALRGAAA